MTPTDEDGERHFLVHVLMGTVRIMILYFLLFVGVLAFAYAQGQLNIDWFSEPGSIAAFLVKALPMMLLFSLSIGWGQAMRKSDTETVVMTGASGAMICSVLCSPFIALNETEDASTLGPAIVFTTILMFFVSCLIIFGFWYQPRNDSEPH